MRDVKRWSDQIDDDLWDAMSDDDLGLFDYVKNNNHDYFGQY